MPTRLSTRTRLLLGGTALLLLLAAGYLVGANLFLRSGFLERVLNRHPDHFTLHYGSAWTAWPGLVHVEHVELRGQARRRQWWVGIDRGTIAIDLPWLLRREFSATSVSVSGVAVHLRRRPDADTAGEAPAQEPAIPGLANTPAPAETAETEKAGWRIRLAGVRLEQVREAWIEDGRFTGDATVAGAMDLRMGLGGSLTLAPATAAIHEGAFAVSGRPLLSGVAGEVRFELPAFDPHHLEGGFLPLASGRARLAGRVESLGFLQPYLRDVPWIELGGNAGPFAADLRVRRGFYLPGTHAEARPDSVTARLLDDLAWGRCKMSWDVGPAGGGSLGRLVAAFDEFRLGRAGSASARAAGRGLRIEVATRDLRIAAIPAPASLAVDLPPTVVGDFSSYNANLPHRAGITLRAGTGVVSATLRAAAPSWEGSGGVDLRGRGVEVDLPGARLRGNLTVQSRFRALPRQRRLELTQSRVEVSDVMRLDGAGGGSPGGGRSAAAVNPGSATAANAGWWARVQLDYFAVQPGSPQALQARMRSTLSDTRPLFAVFAPHGRPLLGWLDRLLDLHPIDAVGVLSAGDGYFALDRLALTAGRADIRARLRFAGGRTEGVLFAAYGPLSVGVEMRGGQRTWKLVHARRWFESQPGTAPAPAQQGQAGAK